jgi:hypothetical protein
VFEPVARRRNDAAAELVRFVREKFYWSALFFAPLWMLWHALWLGFVGWLLAVATLAGVAYWLGLDPNMTMVLLWLPSVVAAFEGAELRRRKLLRRGYRDAGVAVGTSLEDAERRFFAGWASRLEMPAENRPRALYVAASEAPAASAVPVIGLFPEPGGHR